MDDAAMQKVLADLAANEEAARRIREEAQAASFTVQGPKRLFTVTMSGQGELTGIAFRGDAYRDLPPAELAAKLVETVREARMKAMTAALAAFGGMGIPDLPSAATVAAGATTADELLDTMMEALLEGVTAMEPFDPGAGRTDGRSAP